MSDEFILTRGEKRQRMDVAHSRVCSFGNSLTAPTPDEEEKKREKEKRDDDRLKSLTDLYRHGKEKEREG